VEETWQMSIWLELVVAIGLASGLLVQKPKVESEEGFVPLFNGKDLDGWQVVRGKPYLVEDGKLVCPARGGGALYTVQQYSDFILRFEFKLTPGANNGVAIRAPTRGNPAYAGIEIQILDDYSPRYRKLRPVQYHGSVYGLVPAKRGALKPPGEWNHEEIVVRGSRVTVKLNGQVIVDTDLSEIKDPKLLKRHPGLKRRKGHIGFLGHGTRVEFRNIRIKVLSSD
jgi:hypothetical protein